METSRNLKYYDEMDDEGRFDWPGRYRRRPAKPKPARLPLAIEQFVQNQDDTSRTFSFTYKAARFEEGWLLDSLSYFYEQHWISDVLRKVKVGKEASVYLCRSGDQVESPLVAAKVYRPRMLRNLRDDHLYREGRVDLDEEGREVHDVGSLHAIVTRTSFGEEIRHQSWIAYEYTALRRLFEAGADVPRPYAMAQNAILMSYLGDEAVPAPTLNEVDLEKVEARELFDKLLRNLDVILAGEYVHGDLSAYNVLYWEGEIALIDFPQVVSPRRNRNAFAIFERDVRRLCEYFMDQGLELEPGPLAMQLWLKYGYPIRAEARSRVRNEDDLQDE